MSMHNDRRHILLMLLCCLIPLVALAAIYIVKVPVSNVLRVGLVLLCPLSHFLMMAFMDHSHEADHGAHTQTIEGATHEIHQH